MKTVGGATNYINDTALGTLYGGTARPKRSMYIDASGVKFTTYRGAYGPFTAETPTNKVDYTYYYWNPADGFNRFVYFVTPMPKDWDGGTLTAIFFWIPESKGSTGVKWVIQARCFGDNENPDQAFGTAITVDDTIQTAAYLHISPESGAITPAGTLAGDKPIMFKVYNDRDNQTSSDVQRLVGIMLKYTATKESDA